mgnify:CR=1 FL=1
MDNTIGKFHIVGKIKCLTAFVVDTVLTVSVIGRNDSAELVMKINR